MAQSACFRCDWEGETNRWACPRCGARLHREGTEAQLHLEPGKVGPPVDRPEEASGPELPVPASRRTRPWAVLAVLAAGGVLAALLLPRTPTPTPPAAPPELGGRLVYGVVDWAGSDRDRLFLYDLATGGVSPGPIAPGVEEIYRSDAGRGWVVLVADEIGGGEAAYVLRGLGREETPILLARGDDVAVGPRGETVAVVRTDPTGDIGGGCVATRVVVDMIDVVTGGSTVVYDAGQPCGGVVSVGIGGGAVFVTLIDHDEASVHRLVDGAMEPVLSSGYLLISASPIGDLLMVRWDSGAFAGGPDRDQSLLYRPGRGGILEIRNIRSSLRTEQMLAWAVNGSRGAVLGTLDGDRGLWIVEALPGGDQRAPVAFGPRAIRGEAGAAFSPDGRLFAAVGGGLLTEGRLRQQAGVFIDLPLPADVPPPSGPVAWVP